jgi:hypothetical protein
VSKRVLPSGRHDAEERSIRLSEVLDGDPQGLECPREDDVDAASPVHQHFIYMAFSDHMINE